MLCHLCILYELVFILTISFRFILLFVCMKKLFHYRRNSDSEHIFINGDAHKYAKLSQRIFTSLENEMRKRKGKITCTTLRVESALISSTEPRTDLGARMHAMTPSVVVAVSQRHSSATRDYFPIRHNCTLHPIATR